MFFRKKSLPAPVPEDRAAPPAAPPAAPQVLDVLQRLERGGVQLLIRPGGIEEFTSEVVGLGLDAFFIDTLSPPDGDRRLASGSRVGVETLLQGITYTFTATVLGKVQFVDELPAFKLSYPEAIEGVRRRQSPRIETPGDASISFLQPFACDAVVVNLSEGGLAFEYEAQQGRLGRGAVVRDALLELGGRGILTVHGRVVGNLVAELGGISLPSRYRGSLAFQGLSAADRETIRSYLEDLQGVDVVG